MRAKSSRFDVVTTGYGIRNVPDIAAAIAEIARVLKPGGVFVSLDFDRPAQPLVRAVYLLYLAVAGWLFFGRGSSERSAPVGGTARRSVTVSGNEPVAPR